MSVKGVDTNGYPTGCRGYPAEQPGLGRMGVDYVWAKTLQGATNGYERPQIVAEPNSPTEHRNLQHRQVGIT